MLEMGNSDELEATGNPGGSSVSIDAAENRTCEEPSDEVGTSSWFSGNCTGKMRRMVSRGILFAVVAALFLTAADFTMSILTKEIDTLLVIVYYSPLVASASYLLIFAMKLSAPSGKRALLLLAVNGFNGSVFTNCIIGAIGRIPVADAVSIIYCTPVFAAILGCIFLKQLVKLVEIPLIALCIGGVMLIARPSFLFFDSAATRSDVEIVGILLAIGGALSYALSLILVSQLLREGVHRFWMIGTGTTCNFFVNVVLCSVWKKWAVPDPLSLLLLVALYALFSFSVQLCTFTALNSERAVNVSVMLTSEIVLLYILQVFILKVVTTWLTLPGASMVIVSCIVMTILHGADDNNGDGAAGESEG